MADTPLFTLDAEQRYRLAYDAQQWVIHRRKGKPSTGDFKGSAIRETGYRPVWHVGSEKRILRQFISGERPPLTERPRIHLTPEANHRLDMLPDTFREFQAMAVPSTMAA